jgi:Alpha/beta hydrolase family
VVKVVGVHGISQQQGGRLQLIGPWQQSLGDGVERARGRDFPKPSLDIAYYGEFFLESSISKRPVPDDLIEFDADTVSFFETIQDEVVDPARPVEPADMIGAAKGMRELPTPLAKLASWAERKFGAAGKVLFFGDLTQVRRYQRDDALGRHVLARVREALDDGRPRILIGHSLGSIVAYEALCMIPDHGISTLVTIGSPLGLRSIREALRPRAREVIPAFPPGVSRWVNVYDKNDPVALAGALQPYWGAVVDKTVDNGDRPHAATRYLGKKETGDPVADTMAAT